MPTNKATFTFSYDGPDLVDGLMDVRDLAPALLALGGMVERVNELENGNRARASVQAHADFQKGSFEVLLFLDVSLLETTRELFSSFSIKDAKELADLIFGGTVASGGLFGLWKLLRRGKPEKVLKTDAEDKAGSVTLIFKDNSRLTVSGDEYRLSQDAIVRREAAKIVEPVAKREGITEVSVKQDGRTTLRIEKDDAIEIFEAANTPAELGDIESRTHRNIVFLRVIKPSFFRDDLKWQFDFGDRSISALVTDKHFMERVHAGERFGEGDVLEARLETIQTRDDKGGIKVAYEVVEVLRHIEASRGVQSEIESPTDLPKESA